MFLEIYMQRSSKLQISFYLFLRCVTTGPVSGSSHDHYRRSPTQPSVRPTSLPPAPPSVSLLEVRRDLLPAVSGPVRAAAGPPARRAVARVPALLPAADHLTVGRLADHLRPRLQPLAAAHRRRRRARPHPTGRRARPLLPARRRRRRLTGAPAAEPAAALVGRAGELG